MPGSCTEVKRLGIEKKGKFEIGKKLQQTLPVKDMKKYNVTEKPIYKISSFIRTSLPPKKLCKSIKKLSTS